MTYRRSRREMGFANSIVSRIEMPSKVVEHIKHWHPNGPWLAAAFTPIERKLIRRWYFGEDEFALLQQWLSELQSEFHLIQWLVISGKEAKQRSFGRAGPPTRRPTTTCC